MMHNVVEKQGYKFTEEFGYIPEDWNVLNIIENSTLKARIGWQGLTTAEYLKSGDYYLVTGTDFCNGKIDWGNCNYVDKNRYNQDKNIQIKEEDILITKDGTIGKIAYIDKISKPTTLNSGVFVVRPKMQNYNPKYLYYVLMSNTFTRFLKKLTAGSSIMHLYQKDFIGFNFQAPSEQSEQEKIAEVLSDIDELIYSTQKLIDKKKNLKTATMQKFLTSQDTWQKYTLGQIGNVLMCKRIMKDETKEIGQIPFYKIGTFGGKPDAYISKNLFEIYKRKYSYPNKGDILISASGTIGRTIIFDGKPAYFQDSNIVWLQNDETKVLNKYLFYLYKTLKWCSTTGGAIERLYSDNITMTQISVPNILEQEKTVRILTDMDSEIETLEKELNKYKDLKTGMMQDLLTGKIRLIKNSNKTEASDLLQSTVQVKNNVVNVEFKDAIIISMLAYKFGSNKYPLGAFRRQKLTYLFKRHNNIPVDEFLKKAMGPYNPKMKYQGAEGIAIRNKYVREVNNRGLVATTSIAKAEEYYNRYFEQESLSWLENNFKYVKNEELEVLATVDYAIVELKREDSPVTLENIKTYINSDREWKPKLQKDFFNDNAILNAMNESKTLLNSY